MKLMPKRALVSVSDKSNLERLVPTLVECGVEIISTGGTADFLKEMGVKYPELTKEYCNCSTKKVQAAMSKQKYNEVSKKSLSEQADILLPIFQDCLTEYQNKIKAEEAKQN